ncbi:MAG TPA: methionine--tRNA ligase subunit beta [archaeon]|nr:methionine--tRNA ligase subunit beta [archaeon]
MERIAFSDWERLDIRIGTVTAAERVSGADKLLKLTVDLGEEARQLVAGIALHCAPEQLVGKQVPLLANMEPKKLRGLESDGMLLVAQDGADLVLLHPERAVQNGARMR